MNKYLKSAHERDTRKKEYLINPISELDALIIWEIIVALGKIKDAESLKSILDEYKFLKDREIYEALLGWNIDHPEGVQLQQEDDEEQKGRAFIEFENELIEVALIKTVTRLNHYNYNKSRMEYRIVLNKDFPDGASLNNFHFTYQTLELREKKIEELKQVLSQKIKIL